MIVVFGTCEICDNYGRLIDELYGQYICELCFAKKFPERWKEIMEKRNQKVYNYISTFAFTNLGGYHYD